MLDPMILVRARQMLQNRGYQISQELSHETHLVNLEVWCHGGDTSAALAMVVEMRDGVGTLTDWTILTESPIWRADLSRLGKLSPLSLSGLARLAQSKARYYERQARPDIRRERGRADVRLDASLRWQQLARELERLETAP